MRSVFNSSQTGKAGMLTQFIVQTPAKQKAGAPGLLNRGLNHGRKQRLEALLTH
jgi:hypothetical protein